MALPRDLKETIQARVARDPALREALLKERVECTLAGEVETGKTVLRDYINATTGFEAIGHLERFASAQMTMILAKWRSAFVLCALGVLYELPTPGFGAYANALTGFEPAYVIGSQGGETPARWLGRVRDLAEENDYVLIDLPADIGWLWASAEQRGSFGPVPLQNLHPYYEPLRPCDPHRYSGPCGFSRLDVSLRIGTTGSHVPYKSLVQLRAAYTPDAARAVSGHPPN